MMQKSENRRQGTEKLFLIVLFFVFYCLFPAQDAHAETITITGDVCANATLHQPDADVKYKPGEDVSGNEVASADVPDTRRMPWPQDVTIPLRLDLKNAQHLSNKYIAPEAVIGTIATQNGKITFNGQPISPDAQAQIQAACRESRGADQQNSRPGKNLLLGD